MKTMKTQLKRTLTLLLALTLLAGILSPSASAVDGLDERIKSIGLRNVNGVIIGEGESLSIAAGNTNILYTFPADGNGDPIKGLSFSTYGGVKYVSSNTNIANVNPGGKITAISEGQATITVSLNDYPDFPARELTVNVTKPEYLCGLYFYTTSSVNNVSAIKQALVDRGVPEDDITTSTNSVQVAAVDVGSNELRKEYYNKFNIGVRNRDAAEFAKTVNELYFGGEDVIFPYTMQSFYYSANGSTHLFTINLDRLPGDKIPVDPNKPVTIKLVNLDDTVTEENNISDNDIIAIEDEYYYGEYFDVNNLYPGSVDNPVTSWSYATLTENSGGGYSVTTGDKQITSAVLLYDDVLENNEVVLYARHDSPPYYVRVVVIENDSDNTDLIAHDQTAGYDEIDNHGRYNPLQFKEAVYGEDGKLRDDTIPITISQYNAIYPNNQFTKPQDYPALLKFMSDNGLLESGDLEIYNAKAHRYHNALDGTENRRFGGGSLVMLTYVVSFKTPTVEIKPADITIYMGGDGYEGAVDADGNELGVTSGFPVPGFTIEPAADIANFDPTEAVLTYENDNVLRSWHIVPYDGEIGDGMTSHGIYRFEPTEGSNTAVRMQFEKTVNGIGTGEIVTDVNFVIEDNLGQDLLMAVYGESIEMGYVKLVCGDAEYAVTSGNGTLKVRSTTESEDYGSVVEQERDVPRGEPGVVAHAGTTYYINNSDVKVSEDAGVMLLFDDIIEQKSASVSNTQLLINRADSELGGASATRRYEAKYLDLVDTNNGNAWVAADENITVYWPLPAGTGRNTSFTLLHFEGLHREMGVDVIESGINSCDVTPVTVENTGTHVKFTVSRAGFSPFILVWDEYNTPITPIPEPDNSPVGLNTEDHVAYIIGYEDGTVRPGANITRAEVATIFFRLLTDETRESYWSQSSGFTDVASGAWYNNAVSTLTRAGILDGYEDGSFRPNASITRAEFTKIAVSFFKHAGGASSNPFNDVPDSAWYAEFVKAAAELGLIDGYEDGTFRPNAPITRAEACTIVNRTLGRAPDKDNLLPEHEMLTWPDNSRDAWYYAQIQEATNSHDYQWLGAIELWTAKLAERDWDALEKEWSNAYSAPGGEVAR